MTTALNTIANGRKYQVKCNARIHANSPKKGVTIKGEMEPVAGDVSIFEAAQEIAVHADERLREEGYLFVDSLQITIFPAKKP